MVNVRYGIGLQNETFTASTEKGEPMSIGKAIKMVIDEYMRVKDYENIEKPISWALYQTWKIVDSKEKRKESR